MRMGSRVISSAKADRALELFETGLKKSVIAERLGVAPQRISGMLQRARQRREKKVIAK